MHLTSAGGCKYCCSLEVRKQFQRDKETGRDLGPLEWAFGVRIYFPGEETLQR